MRAGRADRLIRYTLNSIQDEKENGMAKIYARKIREREINPATGEVWKLADVPERWREQVKELLNAEVEMNDRD